MPRRTVAAFAAVLMLVFASEAAATVGGPCTVRIAGQDIGPREVGATSDPIVVSRDRPVSITMRSEQRLERLKVEIEFAGLRWTVHGRPSTGTSWASEIPVDDWADYGQGLFKVIGSSEGAGFTCEGAALIEVTGDRPLDPLATIAGLAGLTLALIGSFGVIALAVRVGQSRVSPGPRSRSRSRPRPRHRRPAPAVRGRLSDGCRDRRVHRDRGRRRPGSGATRPRGQQRRRPLERDRFGALDLVGPSRPGRVPSRRRR